MTGNYSPDSDPNEPTVWEFLVRAIRTAPQSIVAWLKKPSMMTDHEDAAEEEGGGAFQFETNQVEIQPAPQAPGVPIDAGETPVIAMVERPEATPGAVPAEPAVSYQVNSVTLEPGAGIHIEFSATLPPGTRLHIDLSANPDADESPVIVRGQVVEIGRPAAASKVAPSTVQSSVFAPLQAAMRPLVERGRTLQFLGRWNLPATLFALALIVYLITHQVGLLKYPIYFFSDEAMQPLFAEGLIRDRFIDQRNEIWFPVYVEVDGNRWAPLLPMYLHAVTMTLFGKTALVTRATSAFFSIFAAISISLILKQVFKARFWWLGVLLLAITPTWFLHSRTAFETVTATSLYAVFLWLYLLYRTGRPRAIFPAAVCAAAAFYSYSNTEAVVGVTAIFLLLSDLPYHWQQRRTLLWLIPLGVILALPLLIFEWRNPGALGLHLRAVDSYWFHDIPLTEKLAQFVQKYLYGISPQYWFFSNQQDLERHRMGTMPHILTIFLPFFLVGVVICLQKIRSAPHRILLLVALAAPAGAAQLNIGVLRVLTFVIPACVLIALGLEWSWQFIQRKLSDKPVIEKATQWIVFYVFAFSCLLLLENALKQGPLWFRNYGLYGMQYGAVQLFEEEIPNYLKANPGVEVLISPTWANGTNRFVEFFIPGEQIPYISMGNIDGYLFRKQDRLENLLLIMTPEEFEQAKTNPKLNPPLVEKIVNYPDGNPGFYFVRWVYSPEADGLFMAEKTERMQLIEEQVQINGQPATVRYSWSDIGVPQEMFDNDRYSLLRSLEANPMIVETIFPEPMDVGSISVDFGAQDTTITATLTLDGSSEPVTFSQTYLGVGDPQELVLPFDQSYRVTKIHFEFYSLQGGEEVHIHVREIKFLP